MTFDWAHAWQIVAVLAAAFAGGVLNVIAGGGSLITFPTLLFVGLNPILASATNTVALWPASATGVYGFRLDILRTRRSLLLLLIPSVVGGVIGGLILLRTPARLFELIAPYLVLAATVLIAVQGRIGRWARHDPQTGPSPAWWVVAVIVQLAVSIYGGFFGAGIGILMLATLGLIGVRDLNEMNGLKNLYAVAINGAAIVYFVARGAVVWTVVPVMVVGSVAGGLAGSTLAHRTDQRIMRRVIVGIGMAMTVALVARIYL